MREILFRGKAVNLHNGSKDFVYGQYVQNRDGKMIYTDTWEEGINKYQVIEKTIGQYTGLTDKNGKKIFEGDIVKREFTLWHGETKKTRETQIGVVVYSNRECGFQVEKKCNLRKPWDGDTIEVIGNIHDNPELLKGETNA